YHTWPDPDPFPGSVGNYGYDEIIFTADNYDPVLELLTPGDVVLPALFYVQRRINAWIEGAVSPKLLWDEAGGRMGLKLVPGSLLAALWVQFARAIEGNRHYRECKECGRWFEVSPEAARTSRLFCSGPCRSRAYRGRQELAQKLHAKGHTLEEIARELGSDVG